MSKYVARPVPLKGGHYDYGWGVVIPETITVFEPEKRETDTGLFDEGGRKLFRIDDRGPLGFDLSRRGGK